MNAPIPGLRVLYDARSPAKVTLVIQPGEELVVSEDVANQLRTASGQFKRLDGSTAAPAKPAKKTAAKKSAAKKA